ncbi:hypothetical protein [Streptomyces sp. NBC_01476]|uniref:hypothetical protein n=1 Tax=Streptomyces sp. NBC_01476 TaxID=2903881 RepID=UPI003FCEE3AF
MTARLRVHSRDGYVPGPVWSWPDEAYEQSNTVGRRIKKLEKWRGIATRYDRTATVHLAGLHFAGIFVRSAR